MPGATYEPLANTTLTSTQTEIIFDTISGSYTDLKIIFNFIPTAAMRTRVELNSDTGSNYSSTVLYGEGTAAASTRYISNTYFTFNAANNNSIAMMELNFMSYAGSTNKTILAAVAADENGSGQVSRGVGLWRSTSAITRIRLFTLASTFASGTTATLYGIKAA